MTSRERLHGLLVADGFTPETANRVAAFVDAGSTAMIQAMRLCVAMGGNDVERMDAAGKMLRAAGYSTEGGL